MDTRQILIILDFSTQPRFFLRSVLDVLPSEVLIGRLMGKDIMYESLSSSTNAIETITSLLFIENLLPFLY